MRHPVTVLLVRHASNANVGVRVTGWTPGISLNDKGRAEAEALAERLEGVPVAAIYSSPLERALETAAPLARLRGLEIRQRAEFGEIRYGDWQGRTYESLRDDPVWRRFNTFRGSTRAPGGETMLETQARMVAGLVEIGARHGGETVAVFSHGDAIKSAVMHCLGVPLDFHLRLQIQPAAITILDLSSDNCSVRAINIGHQSLYDTYCSSVNQG
jgi:probable phosphomutase (TIGR03848 family)